MRKTSGENTPQPENPWAIGTKSNKGSTFNRNDQVDPKNPQKKTQHIPKLKERNPFQVLQKLESYEQESEIVTEIQSLLMAFKTANYDIAQFLAEVLVMFDKYESSNTKVLEFILANVKAKELFKDLSKEQSRTCIDALTQSLKTNFTCQNRDSCIRMLAHICFEYNEIDTQEMEKIYKSLQKIAFDPSLNQPTISQNLQGDGSGAPSQTQQNSQKLQRLAINCIGNLILKQSQFSKNNVDQIFLKLKNVFDQLMKKIQQNFRSKRFIQTMSTLIRALQFCLSENNKVKINDNEVVKLFLGFYQLLFLGTPFAEKMLQIKFEENKQGKASSAKFAEKEEMEEIKGDSGSLIIDTSDFSASSDGGVVGDNKESPGSWEGSVNGQITDPYQKIKNHSILCLQYLFKQHNKALFNYWYLLFPSFFMRPQSEFSQYLTTFDVNFKEFKLKTHSQILREPTLFYLLKSQEYTSKMKCTLSYTISILLENSHIQKIQGQLEKEDQTNQQPTQTFVSIGNILGQFLRFLHYQIIEMIRSEHDFYLQNQLIKTLGTLIHITPYKFMKKGLITHTFKTLWYILSDSSAKDQNLKQNVLNTISQAITLADVKDEVKDFFFNKKEQSLLHFLLVQDDKYKQDFKESQDTLQILQKISKIFNYELLEFWEPQFQTFCLRMLKDYDKKKQLILLKTIDEWLKSFQNTNIEDNDEGDQNEVETVEESKQPSSLPTPFKYQTFREFMSRMVQNYMTAKESNETNIAILSILQNLNSEQWKDTFDQTLQNQIIERAFQMKSPSVMKASSIKLFGYLVYLDHFKQNQKFIEQIFTMIFDNSQDTNLNVQVRNSWVLANLCCTIQEIKDPYLIQETLRVCINYACSNKEKVVANSLRALGYFLKFIDLTTFKSEILSLINKSQVFLNKLPPQMFSSQTKQLQLGDILKLIIENLANKNPKISWNSCVAIGNIVSNPTLDSKEILYSEKTVETLIFIMTNKPNYKTRIHSAQTLMKYEKVEQLGGSKMVGKLWEALLMSFENINQMISSYSEQKYVPSLEKQIIDLWVHVAGLTEHADSVCEFLNEKALNLLQVIKEYLRKELKVPLYSGFYDEMDLFKIETENLFKEKSNLEQKLNLIKVGLKKVRDMIKESEQVHVSFGVFEEYNQLANTDVKLYRELEVLKVSKSSFDPNFQ